jgi:hypothetical protein
MTNKNAEYQKKLREKRKDEGKKSLQIPADAETVAELDDFKKNYGLKNNEKALVRLLENHKSYLDLKFQKEKPPTLKEWWIGLFSRKAGE